MKKSVLIIIIDLEFDVTNLYKFIPSKDIILFNLNLEIVIYEELLIRTNGFISSVTTISKLNKTLLSFIYWLSIFSIYASIRTIYNKIETMDSILFLFIREINYYQLNFEWSKVLRYFFEIFRWYQALSTSIWIESYIKAYAKHLNHNSTSIIPSTSTMNQSHKSLFVKMTS